MVDLQIKDLKYKMLSLKEKKNNIYFGLNDIHPNILQIIGGRDILLSNVDIVLESKEWEQKLDDENILRYIEIEEEYKKEEIYDRLQSDEDYFDGNDYDIKYLQSIDLKNSKYSKEILDYISNYKSEVNQLKRSEYNKKNMNSKLVFNSELNNTLCKIEEVLYEYDMMLSEEIEAQGYLDGSREFYEILEDGHDNYLPEEVYIGVLDVVSENIDIIPDLKVKEIYGDKELSIFQIGKRRRFIMMKMLDELKRKLLHEDITKKDIDKFITFIEKFVCMSQNEFTNFQKREKRRNSNGLTSREQKKRDTILKIQQFKKKGFNQKQTAIKTGFSTSNVNRYWNKSLQMESERCTIKN